MNETKSMKHSVLSIARVIVPAGCAVVFLICWIIDICNSSIHGHHYNGQPPGFWKTIDIISDVLIVNAWFFAVGFPVFMLARPLPVKHKTLRLVLRLFVSAVVCAFFFLITYISVGAFVGWGG